MASTTRLAVGGLPPRCVAHRCGRRSQDARLHHELAAEFEPPPALPAAVLAWSDLTSSPSGERWAAHDRIDEILGRYPADSVVHRAMAATQAELLGTVARVERLLATSAAAA